MLDLGRTFLQSVERSGDACALVDGERRLTYRQWHDRIAAVAAGLRSLGLGRGDHLLVVMQNRWEMATLHWACQFLGIVVTPLNWRAKADEIDYCLEDAGARAVVFDPVVAEALAHSTLAPRLARIGVGAAEGASVRFDDWLGGARSRSRRKPMPAMVADALHLGHHRPAERRAAHATAPNASPRSPMSRRTAIATANARSA